MICTVALLHHQMVFVQSVELKNKDKISQCVNQSSSVAETRINSRFTQIN